MTCQVFAIVLWLGCIGGGFGLWEIYETTAGPNLPTDGDDAAQSDACEPELAVYLHPHCPCSAASVAAVAELAARLKTNGSPLAIRIVFVRPSGVESGWEHTKTWDAASAIPGVRVVADDSGNEARRTSAATSGYAVFRDVHGDVKFRGGLTSSRGRLGESRGCEAILALAAGNEPLTREAPTFGCPLFEMNGEF